MRKIKRWFLTTVCLAFIVSAGWILFAYMEGNPPTINESTPDALGSSQTLSFSISDAKSGLRRIWVGLHKDDKEVVLFEKEFPYAGFFGGKKQKNSEITIDIEPKQLGIQDGKAVLRIGAWDNSWRRWWHGNRNYVEKEVLIDTTPPEVEVLTRFHNINQGGAALIVYKISEACRTTGVQVGENFFPGHQGYFENPSINLAFFSLSHDQGPKTELFLSAVDMAGNQAKTGFYAYLKRKSFKKDIINISDSFLQRKMPEFGIDVPKDTQNPLLQQFLIVNRDIRAENYGKLIEITQKTDPKLYWEGTFLRLPNSARKAGFADRREYRYNKTVIDHQNHLGIDLASVSKSKVPAANRGKVVFAENLGIYGNTIVIDHGFGLMSMYAHLSSFSVKVGQVVEKGDVLGRTGSTGLAGGDHLHFGIIIHNTFVNPIEWWDSNWIMHNVTDKLKDVSNG
jgi:murein DD-endopeptidase MepM/ murein hydrolase activator NlpD